MGMFTGLHSWLFFAKREQDRKANYLGYIDKLDLSGVSGYMFWFSFPNTKSIFLKCVNMVYLQLFYIFTYVGIMYKQCNSLPR